MNNILNIFLVVFFAYSFTAFVLGIRRRKNPFGLCTQFVPLGAFVWVDAAVLGIFFSIVTVICFVLQQWILFLLIFSIFWTVRSIGEQIYWFLEQFAPKHRNAPHTLWPRKFFKGEESWIVMQITWQCVTVLGIISTVWLFNLFLK